LCGTETEKKVGTLRSDQLNRARLPPIEKSVLAEERLGGKSEPGLEEVSP